MGSWALGLQLPSRKATTAFAPCVRALQIPNLEGEGIIQNGLETQLDVRHFLKRPGPLSACWADWDLGREEKSMSLFLSFLFRHPNLQLLNGEFSVTGPLCVLQDWCSWHYHPGGLEDMRLEAHRAPNLPTFRSRQSHMKAEHWLMTWGQEWDASLRLVEAPHSEMFYFGVRGFVVKIWEWK